MGQPPPRREDREHLLRLRQEGLRSSLKRRRPRNKAGLTKYKQKVEGFSLRPFLLKREPDESGSRNQTIAVIRFS